MLLGNVDGQLAGGFELLGRLDGQGFDLRQHRAGLALELLRFRLRHQGQGDAGGRKGQLLGCHNQLSSA